MSKPGSPVDQDLIRAIAELLNSQNLAEIEIEQDDFRVRVTRSFAAPAAPVQYAAPPPSAPVPRPSRLRPAAPHRLGRPPSRTSRRRPTR